MNSSLLHTQNITSTDLSWEPSIMRYVCVRIAFTLCTASIIFNSSAALAVSLGVKEKRPIHKFLISLSASETMYATSLFFESDNLITLATTLQVTSMLLQQLNLVLLASDQYVAVCMPLHYNYYFSDAKANKWVVGLWCVWIVSEVTFILIYTFCNGKSTNTFFLIFDVTTLIVTCFMLLSIYGKILQVVRRIGVQPSVGISSQNVNRKGIYTVIVIFLTYALFHLPYICISLLLIGDDSTFKIYYSDALSMAFVVMCLNLICDPLTYSVRMSEIRKAYKRIFRRGIDLIFGKN